METLRTDMKLRRQCRGQLNATKNTQHTVVVTAWCVHANTHQSKREDTAAPVPRARYVDGQRKIQTIFDFSISIQNRESTKQLSDLDRRKIWKITIQNRQPGLLSPTLASMRNTHPTQQAGERSHKRGTDGLSPNNCTANTLDSSTSRLPAAYTSQQK